MADDTRPRPGHGPGEPPERPGSFGEPDPAPLDALCPLSVRQELAARRAEGEALLAKAARWAHAASAALSCYEDGLVGKEVTDDLHRAIGAEVGVNDLFAIGDEFARIGEILAGPGR